MNPQKLIDEATLQALLKRAQQGDSEAFGAVYDHFFTPVYRYTAFRAPAEMVEDVVADIFVKAWEKLHTYKLQTGVPFAAWLFRIARHTIIDAYRTERSFDEVSDDTIDPDDMNLADHRARKKDLLKIVRKTLFGLPKRYREILMLSYIAELPHREVARTLKLTEGAVRILKFRALKKFEKSLPPEWKDRSA